jgi:phage baseplate assembly protein V
MNDHEFALSEAHRKVSQLIRFGVVTAVDLANAMVQCSCGGLETEWLPWFAGRAGATRKWSPPSVGEQVIVFAPSGDTTTGFVLAGFYQDDHPAPSQSATEDRTTFADGSEVIYDAAAHTLTVNVGTGNVIVNCKVATVKAETSVTLDTPEATVTGNLTVQKNLGVTGAMNVQGQGADGAVSTFAGSISIKNGDVQADDISLKGHHHTAQGESAPTTPAQA